MTRYLRIANVIVNEDHILKVELNVELEGYTVVVIHLTRGEHITLQGDEAEAAREFFTAAATNIIAWYASAPR